jgi:probable HAF family extracellular repeat protein
MNHGATNMKSNLVAMAALGLSFNSLAGTNGPVRILDLGPTTTLDATGYSALNDHGELAGYTLESESHGAAAPHYSGHVTAFGNLGGDYAHANAVCESDEVIGYSYVTGNTGYHATIFRKNGPQDLGTLGGDDSIAYAINDAGRIAGLSTLAPGDSIFHAVIFSQHHAPIDLGTLGGSNSAAFGINRKNIAVGMSSLSGDSIYHAALFTAYASPLDLGTLGGNTAEAHAINERGSIVGSSTLLNQEGTTHAAVFSPGRSPTDLGTLGGPSSQAVGINDKEIVVGFADTAQGQPHAALWRNFNGTWVLTDINTMIDPTSGWTIDFAYGINDRDVIEAVGRGADNIEHTLLLSFKTTPSSSGI